MKRVEGHALLLARLGEAYLLDGRIGDAQTIGCQALQLARETGQRGHEAYALCLMGDIGSRELLVDIGAAEASYCQAFALVEELSMRPLLAHCHAGLGRLYGRTAKRQEAQQHLITAMAIYRELDMPYWLEKAKVDMGQLQSDENRG